MYESYFAFQRAPFSIAPDPSFLYPSPQHKDGLEHLLYGLQKAGGFIVLTGEVGTGKTTLCRLFMNKLPAAVRVATVLNARLNAGDLLSAINQELQTGLASPQQASEFDKSEAIRQTLAANHQRQLKTLLIIEEAQNLPPDALETLRLLTNYETDTTKLLHILLIGQPELVATLNRPDLRQLAQRVVARFHLQPLSLAETRNYITHRLNVAGGQNDVFKKSAVTTLYHRSQGIPRLINLIADRSLLTLCNEGKKQATSRHIEAAAAVIQGPSRPPAARATGVGIGSIVVGITVLVLGIGAAVLFLRPGLGNIKPVATTPTPPATTTPAVAINTIDIDAELLGSWGLTSSSGDLCRDAAANELKCLTLQTLSISDLLSYNRPAIVTVFNQQEQNFAPMALLELDDQNARLVTSTGPLTLPRQHFEQRWRGDATLLWQPPPGYIRQPQGWRQVTANHPLVAGFTEYAEYCRRQNNHRRQCLYPGSGRLGKSYSATGRAGPGRYFGPAHNYSD